MNQPKRIYLLCLFCLLALGISAQNMIRLSPNPRQVEWGAALESLPQKVIVGTMGDKAVKKFKKFIPQHAEGYYLNIDKDRIVIAGYDTNGTFYGEQTLKQLREQNCMREVTISDYPTMPERGVIEGFYGNPYSQQNRLDLFRFMGANKMNIFIYGPKDDPYHRAKWRVPYPQKEADDIRLLATEAEKSHVKFVWAIHPGVDIHWNLQDSLAIVKKLESVYSLGVRSFCVFFDDIGGEGTKAEKQAGLLNYITDSFVKKHKDVASLIMCPTQYNKSWSGGDYLNILGTQMYPSVRIMWTGNSVVDMIESNDMEWINNQIHRKAFIWLNYPVTDYCINHLLMGPTYGNGNNIGSMVSGFCSNPMEYCEASKVSLFSLADYTWNPLHYDSLSSWQQAMHAVYPEQEQAFRVFCENNIDLGVTGHGLRRAGESPEFRKALQSDNPTRELSKFFLSLKQAGQTLQKDDSRPQLKVEILPWVKSMVLTGERGDEVLKMRDAFRSKRDTDFIDAYLSYDRLTNEQNAIRSRDFQGSIKVASPVVATNYVEPWIRQEVQDMVSKYKKISTYRLDVFPVQIVEDGSYFIKVNGKYLTDTNPAQPGLKASLVEERDTINPQRQEWTIQMVPETQRFKIVNNQGNRYLNEIGCFGGNAYSAAWNTYVFTKQDGRYAIRNAGNGGNKYWTIEPSSSTISFVNDARYVFELIPIK